MLKPKYCFLALLILTLLGCQQINNSQKDGEKVYEISKLVNGTMIYEKKTLNQITKDDVTNGNFMYRQDGGLVITDIRSEEDKKLVESYFIDLFSKPKYITKYDNYTQMEKPFVVFKKKMLSYNPELKSFDPEFFMNDYELNWRCFGMLESYQRLQQCDFSVACEVEADFHFEKWCMRRIAELTNDESWCNKTKINVDWECYWEMAIQKKDEKLCWKIEGGDNPVVACFKSVAKVMENPEICEEIKLWYEDKLKDKNPSPSLIEKLSKDFINECKREVDESREFRSFEDLNEDELKEINELIDCKKFKFESRSEHNLCEDYVYKKKKIEDINNCISGFKFDYEIASCLAANFPINELEELENNYQEQTCNFLDLKQNESIPIAGRVTKKGYHDYYGGWYFIDVFSTHRPDVRSCGGVNCESKDPMNNINPGDGVYIIADYVKFPCPGAICSRCEIKEIKKVFKP